MSKTLSNYFAHITVKDFPQTSKNDGKVIVVKSTDNLKAVMGVLVDNNIYSTPIYDEELKQYIGMVDMGDIVDFISKNFEETQMLGKGFEAIFNQAEKFISAKVIDVIAESQRTPFVPISVKASMLDVAMLFNEHNVHRVNVFDDDENLINIITKSALLEQLQKHKELVSEFSKRTASELNLGTSPVISVDISDSTFKAFNILRESNLYAVPVVNIQLGNSIVANISAKDVRAACSDPSRLHLLYGPISKFLATVTKDSVDIASPSITCKDTDTFESILEKLVVNKIHRVYVIDPKSNAPKKVISLTDILHCVVE